MKSLEVIETLSVQESLDVPMASLPKVHSVRVTQDGLLGRSTGIVEIESIESVSISITLGFTSLIATLASAPVRRDRFVPFDLRMCRSRELFPAREQASS